MFLGFATSVGPKPPTNSRVRCEIKLHNYTRAVGIRVCQDTTSLPSDEFMTIDIAKNEAGVEV